MYNSSEGVGGTFATIRNSSVLKLYYCLMQNFIFDKSDIIMDLGAGQNEVMWHLAQLLDCRALGVEICPHRVFLASKSAVAILENKDEKHKVSNFNVGMVLGDICDPSMMCNAKGFYVFDTA